MDNPLSDRLPGFNVDYQCGCCKPDEPKFFWLDSFEVEIFLEEMEDGEIGYSAYVELGDACWYSGPKDSYHLAKVAARESVNAELALRRVFMLCNKFWVFVVELDDKL